MSEMREYLVGLVGKQVSIHTAGQVYAEWGILLAIGETTMVIHRSKREQGSSTPLRNSDDKIILDEREKQVIVAIAHITRVEEI